MTPHTNPTLALTQSGFTPTQANALAAAIERSAAGAVDDLRHDLQSWHIHLALYLLIQIGVVLLVIMMVQVMRDPTHAWRAPVALMDSSPTPMQTRSYGSFDQPLRCSAMST